MNTSNQAFNATSNSTESSFNRNSSFIDMKENLGALVENSFGNHWSSAADNPNKITKLDEKHIYMIIDVEKLQTSFGKKYVLVDDSGAKYWTNNKIDKFIKAHKDIKRFQLITSEFKSFKNKKGETIKYLVIDINF